MDPSSHTDQSPSNSLPYSEHRIPRGNFTISARHYAGKGPAFVFMHGFPDNLHIYDRLIPLLQGHQVITFDFLGWGDSDLGEKQSEVARQFATSRPDKFAGLSFSYGELGVPLLDDMLATIECRVVEMVSGGTHTVFLAEVEVAQAREGMPLTYFRGRMGRFADIGGQHTASLWRDMQWENAA